MTDCREGSVSCQYVLCLLAAIIKDNWDTAQEATCKGKDTDTRKAGLANDSREMLTQSSTSFPGDSHRHRGFHFQKRSMHRTHQETSNSIRRKTDRQTRGISRATGRDNNAKAASADGERQCDSRHRSRLCSFSRGEGSGRQTGADYLTWLTLRPGGSDWRIFSTFFLSLHLNV